MYIMVILMYLIYPLYRIPVTATCNIRPGSNNHLFRWLLGTGQVLSPCAVYNTAASPDNSDLFS